MPQQTQDIANRPIFTATNVVIIVGFVVSIVTNQMLFKMQVQEIILNNKADNRVYEMRFQALEKQDNMHELTLNTMAKSIGDMLKPEEIEYKTHRK